MVENANKNVILYNLNFKRGQKRYNVQVNVAQMKM